MTSEEQNKSTTCSAVASVQINHTLPPPEPCLGEWLEGGFQAGLRPDSPSRGDLFLLPPFSTVRSVVFRWMLGWVEVMVFVR